MSTQAEDVDETRERRDREQDITEIGPVQCGLSTRIFMQDIGQAFENSTRGNYIRSTGK